MSTVYLVTSGMYSNYRVVAVFSTRSAAEAYIRDVVAVEPQCDMQVEDYPLDAPREQLPGAYLVLVNDAGEIVGEPRYDSSYPIDQTRVYPVSPWNKKRSFLGYGLTVEHARRSAEELRRQTLALEGKVVSS